MQDERRGYTQAASDVTEQTTAWARDLAAMLIGQGLQLSARAPELLGQAQQAVEDMVAGLKGNREMIAEVAGEQVERAVGRMGLVQQDELAALRARLERLEDRLEDLEARLAEAQGRMAASLESRDVRDWSQDG